MLQKHLYICIAFERNSKHLSCTNILSKTKKHIEDCLEIVLFFFKWFVSESTSCHLQ